MVEGGYKSSGGKILPSGLFIEHAEPLRGDWGWHAGLEFQGVLGEVGEGLLRFEIVVSIRKFRSTTAELLIGWKA